MKPKSVLSKMMILSAVLFYSQPAHAWYGWFDFLMDWGVSIDCPGCPGHPIYSSINSHSNSGSGKDSVSAAPKSLQLVFGPGPCPRPGACLSDASSLSEMSSSQKADLLKKLQARGYTGGLESAKPASPGKSGANPGK